jgi:hypothetical protein
MVQLSPLITLLRCFVVVLYYNLTSSLCPCSGFQIVPVFCRLHRRQRKMNSEDFLRGACLGNVPRVQKMLADGEACITDVDRDGRTALLYAAMGGTDSLPTLKWLLEEGGACITDRDRHGHSALLMAAMYGRLATCQWLLEHGGADVVDRTNAGDSVWDLLIWRFSAANVAEVTTLLRVMVLKGAPPAELLGKWHLRAEYVRVVEGGARLMAALPAYLARRRALLDAHCPLIVPLLDLVRDYDPEPITTKELWATGLGVAPRRARRARVEAAVALLLVRSARLRQRLK